jgi:hypothetical protein
VGRLWGRGGYGKGGEGEVREEGSGGRGVDSL